MVKNHCLAKSINDACWYDFRVWLEYLGKVFERKTIAIMPNGTSQECCNCGTIVKKSLSTGTVIVAVYSIAIVSPLEISSPEGIGYGRTDRNLSIKSR